jgi:hypothetical protein
MRHCSRAPLATIAYFILGSLACSSGGTTGTTSVPDAATPTQDVGSKDVSLVQDVAGEDVAPDVAIDSASAIAALDAGSSLDVAAGSDKFIAMTEGQPASLWWEASNSTLYIADNQNNQVWSWTEAAGLAKYGTTAATAGEIDAGATLVGQLVRQSDGTVVVARFGSPRGSFAAVSYILPDGGSGLVPGVDPDSTTSALASTRGTSSSAATSPVPRAAPWRAW